MKWFYKLNKQAQIITCLITTAVSILWITIFAVMEQLVLTLIGIAFFAVAIFFIYCYSHAEKERLAEQAAARQKNGDPEIKESDSKEYIIALARERANKIIQTGDDNAIRSRLNELKTLIMPEAEREKLCAPDDIPIIQRQIVLLYETEALMQYLIDNNGSSDHGTSST